MSSNTTTPTLSNILTVLTSPCYKTLSDPSALCTVSYWIYTLRPYVILTFGTLGNFLNIVTLLRKRLRTSSTAVFLIFLAVSDTLFLHVMRNIGKLQIVSDLYCKLFWFIASLAGEFSSWLLVLVSSERMLYLKRPIFARDKFTWRSALVTTLVTLSVLALMTGHILFGNELHVFTTNTTTGSIRVSRLCTSAYSTETYKQFRESIWPTVTTSLPLCIISINTIMIIVGLRKQRRQVATTHHHGNTTSTRDQRIASVSRTMVFVCVYNIFSSVPVNVFPTILKFSPPASEGQNLQIYVLLFIIITTINLSKYALNCVFYFSCGTLFRREWTDIILTLRRQFRQDVVVGRVNTDDVRNGVISRRTVTTTVDKSEMMML